MSPGIQVRVMDEAEVLETVSRGWSGGTAMEVTALSTEDRPSYRAWGTPMLCVFLLLPVSLSIPTPVSRSVCDPRA